MRIKHQQICAITASLFFLLSACNAPEQGNANQEAENSNQPLAGQSAVVDDVSAKDIVKVAVSSPDHTTLVAAVKAAELVDVLANAGPFTVFAPTNAAFDALPPGTVDDLLKPENKDKLINILEYHVAVAVFNLDQFTDGQQLEMVNGSKATFGVKDGKVTIDGANVIATVPATNGIIHVIDAVILPK